MNFSELLKNANVRTGLWVVGVLLIINLVLILINLVLRKNEGGILGVHKLIRGFFLKVFAELKLVEWLSAKDTVRYTVIVLIAAVLLGALIALLDFGFFKLRDLII